MPSLRLPGLPLTLRLQLPRLLRLVPRRSRRSHRIEAGRLVRSTTCLLARECRKRHIVHVAVKFAAFASQLPLMHALSAGCV